MNKFKVSIIGQTQTGKSKFISSFLSKEIYSDLIYENNNFGKTKINKRYNIIYNFRKQFEISKFKINIDYIKKLLDTKNNTENNLINHNISNILENIKNDLNELNPNFSFDKLIYHFNLPNKETKKELENRVISIIYFEIQNWIDINGIHNINTINELDSKTKIINYISEIEIDVKMDDKIFDEINIENLTFVDTRGILDSDSIFERIFPNDVDANILMIKENQGSNDIFDFIKLRLQDFFNIPTDIVIRSERDSTLFKSNIYFLKDFKSKENSTINLFKEKLQDLGLLPSGTLDGITPYSNVLLNELGSSLPIIIDTGSDEKQKEQEKQYTEIAIGIIKKLISLAENTNTAISKTKQKISKNINLINQFKSPLFELSMHVTEQIFNKEKIFKQMPRLKVLTNHLENTFLSNKNKPLLDNWEEAQYLHNYATDAATKVLTDYMKKLNKSEIRSDANDEFTPPEKIMFLKGIFNYINNLDMQKSYKFHGKNTEELRIEANYFCVGVESTKELSRYLYKEKNISRWVYPKLNLKNPVPESIFIYLITSMCNNVIDIYTDTFMNCETKDKLFNKSIKELMSDKSDKFD